MYKVRELYKVSYFNGCTSITRIGKFRVIASKDKLYIRLIVKASEAFPGTLLSFLAFHNPCAHPLEKNFVTLYRNGSLSYLKRVRFILTRLSCISVCC